MSVTLYRNKNGKQVPIKLSIWDAFKGAPLPKPRPHKCGSCGIIHNPVCKPKAESVKDAKDSESVKSKTDSKSSKDAEKKIDSGFTPEEDAKIKEMKAADSACPWVKIAEALDNKHNKDACKHRYKELQDAEKGGDGKDAKNDDEAKKTKSKDNKNGNKEKDTSSDSASADRPMGKKEKKQAAKEARDTDKKEAEAHKQDEKPTEAATVETTKPTEAPTLPVSANDKQKWITAAAKHFDKTGLRITPDQARRMAEEAT